MYGTNMACILMCHKLDLNDLKYITFANFSTEIPFAFISTRFVYRILILTMSYIPLLVLPKKVIERIK